MTNDKRTPGRPPKDGQTASGHIHLRTTLDRKSAYVRAARPRPLAEWMTDVCDQAAQYKPDPGSQPGH